MQPVRVKDYGLIPMTKRGFLLATAMFTLCVAIALVVAYACGRLPPFHWPWEQGPITGQGPIPWVVNNFYTILFVILVFEAINFSAVMRRFARKEAEQRARLSQGDQTHPIT